MFAKKLSAYFVIAGASLFFLVYVLFIGYYYSYVDHDKHVVYFVKKYPTFKRNFVNPFADEGDHKSVAELTPDLKNDMVEYCTYAFGETLSDTASLTKCREKIIREIE